MVFFYFFVKIIYLPELFEPYVLLRFLSHIIFLEFLSLPSGFLVNQCGSAAVLVFLCCSSPSRSVLEWSVKGKFSF